MIYVVEVPSPGKANAWFAFDQGDFLGKVHAAKATGDWTIFAATTPRQQLDATGSTADASTAGDAHALISKLAEEHGWDTVLYRADYLLSHGIFQAEPVSEFEACVAAVAHDLLACRIYLSDEAATAALYRDPLYDGREGFHAHMALREQLIALEVISDDL